MLLVYCGKLGAYVGESLSCRTELGSVVAGGEHALGGQRERRRHG